MSKKEYLKALAFLRVNNDRNRTILLHQAKGTLHFYSLMLLWKGKIIIYWCVYLETFVNSVVKIDYNRIVSWENKRLIVRSLIIQKDNTSKQGYTCVLRESFKLIVEIMSSVLYFTISLAILFPNMPIES